jgi:hypothetical protein
MPKVIRAVCVPGVLALGVLLTGVYGVAEKTLEGPALVVVLKNGKQQSFAMADVARIEFPGAASSVGAPTPSDSPGRGHFLGKWELGQGNGSNFYVTLEANGEASKSIGSNRHGTWKVFNGEARITWDDGSHDAIRKVGNKYEKFWYPDDNFSGKPNNVTEAERIESKPI